MRSPLATRPEPVSFHTLLASRWKMPPSVATSMNEPPRTRTKWRAFRSVRPSLMAVHCSRESTPAPVGPPMKTPPPWSAQNADSGCA